MKDTEVWHATVHGVSKIQIQLSDWTTTMFKIVNYENRLCSTGNPTWWSLVTWVERKSKEEGIYVYVWLIHFAVWQKLHDIVKQLWSEVKSLSRAQLFATPWRVACTKLLHPWDFLGKSTGVGYRFLLQESSRPRDRTQVSWIVDRRFTIWATREVPGK